MSLLLGSYAGLLWCFPSNFIFRGVVLTCFHRMDLFSLASFGLQWECQQWLVSRVGNGPTNRFCLHILHIHFVLLQLGSYTTAGECVNLGVSLCWSSECVKQRCPWDTGCEDCWDPRVWVNPQNAAVQYFLSANFCTVVSGVFGDFSVAISRHDWRNNWNAFSDEFRLYRRVWWGNLVLNSEDPHAVWSQVGFWACSWHTSWPRTTFRTFVFVDQVDQLERQN